MLNKFKSNKPSQLQTNLFNKTTQDKPIKSTEQGKEKVNINKILKYCEMPRSKKEIMRYVGLSHKVHFEKRYLYPLMKKGKIAMTIPDKPTSRNQKYVRVR